MITYHLIDLCPKLKIGLKLAACFSPSVLDEMCLGGIIWEKAVSCERGLIDTLGELDDSLRVGVIVLVTWMAITLDDLIDFRDFGSLLVCV